MLNRLSLNRIGLNRIGLNRIGKPSGGSSDRPYIDPKVLDSLCGVWIMDQNTNESESRNIIKNKIADRGGDLELLNFGYKLNSGYGKYELDFNEFTTNTNINTVLIEKNKDTFYAETLVNNSTFLIYKTIQANNTLTDTPSFKAKVEINKGTTLQYRYINSDGVQSFFNITEEGEHEFPISYNNRYVNSAAVASNGFVLDGKNTCRITQIPYFQGALVTDGKDDMIVSQKTVQEMGITDKITVVSMIHQIGGYNSGTSYTNYIRYLNEGYIRNNVLLNGVGKTGIYGYTWNGSVQALINNILGDKSDYSYQNNLVNLQSKFSVEGYINNGSSTECSEVAVYWTFIANKVLTTDEINQIIAYFKLDKYVTPQVIYDVKRQGLTNDTPAADWYLKDFSGNGHDMQLYNFAKKLGSGVGKYAEDFTTWTPQSYVADSTYTSNKLHITNIKGGNAILYTKKGANAMKVKITGIQSFNLVYRYIAENDVWEALEVDRDGIYELPASTTTTKTYYTGFTVPYYTGDCDITIEQIPDYEGALVSDGIDDYGKVENLPIYKDYTVVADREIVDGLIDNAGGGVAIRSYNYAKGAFGFDWKNQAFSFGGNTDRIIDVQRFISYQSKYINNGIQLITGNVVDNNPLYMARLGEENRYSKLALWSFLLFPYSLSEFLLERQLKRYKLGTLYPDMVEFRPVISGNIPYNAIEISQGSTTLYNKSINKTGIYLQEGSAVRVYIQPSGIDEVSKITINGIEYTDLPINPNGFYYADFPITKSPQKISYAIDEYIRYEDIVQPYPAIINLSQNGKSISWGDKLKVDSEVAVTDYNILLPELYTHGGGIRYNGTTINLNAPIIVDKSMVFTNVHSWKLNTTEPHAIYSPQKLNIPNSSLKILGYVPDLTGKGNHGKLNNFAYTEDSGVAADGSIKFDGTDDHITIPTLAHGGKCVMMKVNWSNGGMLYDQRLNSSTYTFGILTSEALPAYNARNNGSTYIDGILNTSIIPSDLVGITHNITAVNDAAIDNNTVSPRLGVSVSNATFSNMSLYEFMLFPEIPSEDEIKKLNDVMGIEGGYVESPNYYWDAYGKKNTDTDRNLIADQVSKDVANALEVKNVAYNSESGYGYGKSNFISIMESSQQFVDIIDDYNFIIKATPHNNNQFFAQVNTPKLIPNNYIRFKVSGIPEDFKMVFGYDYVEGGTNEYSHIIDKNGVYSYDSFNIFYTSFRAYTGYTDLTGLNIKVEFLDYHPNGLLLEGVEDHAVNTVIPAVTDFTVIAKRKWLDNQQGAAFVTKGVSNTYTKAAFMMEYKGANNIQIGSFGTLNSIQNIPDLIITYMTPTYYNKSRIGKGTAIDENGLIMGKYINTYYWKGVFYKMMLYTKTIDQLSINMLKNLFERDELIDVTNPIFKKQ